VAVPCKLYGILASGRAVVAQVPARSEVARVVEEERCGVVVPPADAGALAREIRRLAQAPEEVERMGERAFAAYREKYTLEAGVRAFESGFKDRGENESSAVAAASSRVL
jgi:glycosyltransferase involved in cell wall biosynthesis